MNSKHPADNADRQEIPILFESDDLLVIDKPAGIAVHRHGQQPGIIEYLEAESKLYLVHRLDRDTSGVLLLAKSSSACAHYAEQFAQHRVRKHYVAISDRKPSKKQGWIKGDMLKSRNGNWKLARSLTNPAITHFTSQSLQPNFRRFDLYPQTGRTHQLRVAMSSLGAPILGDQRYGGQIYPRLMLHAFTLEIDGLQLTCPLPDLFLGDANTSDI